MIPVNPFLLRKGVFADVFKSFRKMWSKMYHLDPEKAFSVSGLVW